MAIHGYPGQIMSATAPAAFGSGIWTFNRLYKSGTVVQMFTATDTWVSPAGVTSVDYLVVAAGGGGGTDLGGGGGAGGSSTNSGAGGNGANGYVIVITFF